MSERDNFRHTLREIQNGREAVRSRWLEQQAEAELQKQERLKRSIERVRGLSEHFLSPIIEDVNISLADGKGAINEDVENTVPLVGWKSITWDIVSGESTSWGEDYTYISSYKKLTFNIDENGDVWVEVPRGVETAGHHPVNKELLGKSVNIEHQDWEKELRNQVVRVVNQGLHEWSRHSSDKYPENS